MVRSTSLAGAGDPAAGQDLEGVQVIGSPDDPQGRAGRGEEFAGVAAVGPGELYAGELAPQIP